MPWGAHRFNCYVQNALLAKNHGDTLDPLQRAVLVTRVALMELVRAREDAQDYVVVLDSEAHRRQCPLRFEAGASPAAKVLQTLRWDPLRLGFVHSTVEQWLDTEEHLLSSLATTRMIEPVAPLPSLRQPPPDCATMLHLETI